MIEARAIDVTSLRNRASIGALAAVDHLTSKRTYINKAPQAGQVDTWEYTAFNAGDVIGGDIVVGGITITVRYTVLAGDTNVTGAMSKVKAIFEADPTLGSLFTVTQALGVLTLTGRSPYITWVSNNAQTSMTLTAVSAAAEADAIPVGRALVLSPYSGNVLSSDGVALFPCRLPTTTAVGTQKYTYTVTYESGIDLTVQITFRGVTYGATETSHTSLADTLTDLAAALNFVLPANTVEVTTTATTIIFTSEIPGEAVDVAWTFGDGVTTAAAALTSSQGVGLTLQELFAGVAIRAYDEAPETFEPTVDEYGPNAGVKAVLRGLVWVEAPSGYAGTVSDVYVGTGAANKGKFFVSADTDRVLLPRTVAKALGGDSTVMLIELGALS